jgi:hypothetical protein
LSFRQYTLRFANAGWHRITGLPASVFVGVGSRARAISR